MKLNCPGSLFRRGRPGLIFDHENFRPQKRTILVDLNNFEARPTFGDQVKTAVRILFHNTNDFGHASHVGHTLLERSHHPESAILGKTFSDYFFVAGLKNVQRQGSAGEQHDIEWEQGDEGSQAVSVGARSRANEGASFY